MDSSMWQKYIEVAPFTVDNLYPNRKQIFYSLSQKIILF